MSEFDDFVDKDEKGQKNHQPKKPNNQSENQKEPQQASDPSKTQDVNTESQTVQNQTDEIADSNHTSWNREQFAMFFKEEEVFGYEDLMHDAKGHLKRGYNVRNDKRYEIDQAFIELALERVNSEEVATRLIENRGFEL